jgi:hypothetical protein
LPFFGQNCSLPFSLRSLDIPALLILEEAPIIGKRIESQMVVASPKDQVPKKMNFGL